MSMKASKESAQPPQHQQQPQQPMNFYNPAANISNMQQNIQPDMNGKYSYKLLLFSSFSLIVRSDPRASPTTDADSAFEKSTSAGSGTESVVLPS